MTPENIRYHAAGHLAAAALLAGDHPDAAAAVLREVAGYVNHPTVSAPPQLRDKLAAAADDPRGRRADIALLEAWFVDPFNTVIEQSDSARASVEQRVR